MKLKNRNNGKIIKEGSIVTYCGDKCRVVKIESEYSCELKRLSDGMGWHSIKAIDFDCVLFSELDETISKGQKSLKSSIGRVSDVL